MSISYGELIAIQKMTDEELNKKWYELVAKEGHNYTEDDEDTQNAIEAEMESRGLTRP